MIPPTYEIATNTSFDVAHIGVIIVESDAVPEMKNISSIGNNGRFLTLTIFRKCIRPTYRNIKTILT